MYNNWIEYMADLLDENQSPDYWYDVASESASDLLRNFTDQDWMALRDDLENQSLEYKRKLAYCIGNNGKDNELQVLLQLANTTDQELFETCVDSLREFISVDNRDILLKNKGIIEHMQKTSPMASPPVKKIFDDFLRKIEEYSV